ncbi:membrane-spanning 4-domains subfamily A member 3 [Labrus bergylta]|uniref:membrane-spanning 4-domains subfamily A member 3 n=1 Tax=Labrus bergylta TaxID=56723 RepID=UPI00331352B5
MTSSVSASAGGMLVVTQVYPANSQHQGQQVCEGMQTFSRAHLLAVGTVQIIIGAMVFLFGIVTVATQPPYLVAYSGFFVWGAVFYITAGSLTVAAGKSFNRCLVKTTLGFNVVASMASCTAIIMYTLEATIPLCYYCPSTLHVWSDLHSSSCLLEDWGSSGSSGGDSLQFIVVRVSSLKSAGKRGEHPLGNVAGEEIIR